MFETPELTRLPDGSFTVARTGADVLRELLQVFEEEMRGAGHPALLQLAAGQTREAIVASLAEIGLTPPEELIALYEWHNGFDMSNPVVTRGDVLPSTTFASVEWSVGTFKHIAASAYGPDPFWNPAWIMIEDTRPGYMLDCREDPHVPPRVAYISEDNPFEGIRRRPPVRSFCTLVTVWIDLIRQGALTWQGTWFFDATKLTDVQRASGIVDPY